MLKKLLFGAGMAYLGRKYMGGNRRYDRGHSRSRGGLGSLFGGSRRRSGFGL